MDEQLINTLMEVYAERGVNLTEVIRDPMFKNMSLDSKIKLLKDNADKMIAGSNHAISKADLIPAAKRAGLMAGLATAFGAAGAAKEFNVWGPNFKFPTKTVLGMGAMAGGASLALSALSELEAVRQRKNLYKDFEAARSSTADNAYLKLIVKNQGGPIQPKSLKNPISQNLDKLISKADSLASRDAEIHGRYAAFHASYEANPDIDMDKDPELKTHFKTLVDEHANQSTFKRYKD